MVGRRHRRSGALASILTAALLCGCASGAAPEEDADGGPGVLAGWSVVGTEGVEWDSAVGYWVDSDELAPSAEVDPELDLPEHEGELTVGRVLLLGLPRFMWSQGPGADESDRAATAKELHLANLADTDWALDLTQMGDGARTHWHGTSAWDRLEPVLVESGNWAPADGGLRYDGPSEAISRHAPVVTAPDEDTVLWRPTSLGDVDLDATGPTLADLPAARSLAGCLQGADAAYFHLAPADGDLTGLSREAGVPVTGFALGATVDGDHRAEAWWCAVLPGAAQDFAAAGPPPPSGDLVTPGAPEPLDQDTVRIALTPVEEGPARALQVMLSAPETRYPYY